PNGVSFETLDGVDNGFLDNTQIFMVPSGQYFMLGDNRGRRERRGIDGADGADRDCGAVRRE
ncbi:MAG: hypothetical protein ACRD9W_17615, partial [Terriglobia bacterium]